VLDTSENDGSGKWSLTFSFILITKSSSDYQKANFRVP
jgi:hypothetical protein